MQGEVIVTATIRTRAAGALLALAFLLGVAASCGDKDGYRPVPGGGRHQTWE